MQIIYEPVWRVSLRDERHRFRRLWCVYDPDAGCIFYGKKKKYALQKYNKWIQGDIAAIKK